MRQRLRKISDLTPHPGIELLGKQSKTVRDCDHAIEQRLSGHTGEDFTPAVQLNAGFLPGSVPVSAAASTTPGRGGLLDRGYIRINGIAHGVIVDFT